MAEYYVRSTTGNDANTGLGDWDNAFATIEKAFSVALAGDTVFLSQSHSELYTSTKTLNPTAGTYESPVRIICVNDSSAPPTTLATTALLETTHGVTLSIRGNSYWYGVRFEVNTEALAGNGGLNIVGANTSQRFEECLFFQRSTSTTPSLMTIGTANGSYTGPVSMLNCHFKNGRINNQPITIQAATIAEIIGGTFTSLGAYSDVTFSGLGSSGEGWKLRVIGLDMSALDPAVSFFSAASSTNSFVDIEFTGVKVPNDWTGSYLKSVNGHLGVRGRFHSVDYVAGQRLHVFDSVGTIDSDTGVYLTEGRAGFSPVSYRMTSNSKCSPLVAPLYGMDICAVITDEMIGIAQTATIEIVLDSATEITDDEIWMDAHYPASASYPTAGWASDRKPTPISTAAVHVSSAATWTGTGGFANEQKCKLQVEFTPQSVGILVARVVIGKPSTTVYVDPDVTIAATGG